MIEAKELRPAQEILSSQEHKLYEVMIKAGQNVDVSINDIFKELFVKGHADEPPAAMTTNKQQYVGAFVSRVNRKLLCFRPLTVGQFVLSECIVPGELKRTYRLVIK